MFHPRISIFKYPTMRLQESSQIASNWCYKRSPNFNRRLSQQHVAAEESAPTARGAGVDRGADWPPAGRPASKRVRTEANAALARDKEEVAVEANVGGADEGGESDFDDDDDEDDGEDESEDDFIYAHTTHTRTTRCFQ